MVETVDLYALNLANQPSKAASVGGKSLCLLKCQLGEMTPKVKVSPVLSCI